MFFKLFTVDINDESVSCIIVLHTLICLSYYASLQLWFALLASSSTVLIKYHCLLKYNFDFSIIFSHPYIVIFINTEWMDKTH